MAQTNKTIKDSLFTDLFSNDLDGKKNFLSLYNAIHGSNLKYEETIIQKQNIPQTIYKTLKNDVSMLIDNKLIVMIEHQSTINENMPLRLLEYVARIYEGYFPSRKRYAEKQIEIPTPEFYVFYNGTKKYPDNKVLKLSDSFQNYYPDETTFPQLELCVTVINIGPGQTLKFQNNCAILKQYCDFIEMIRNTIHNEEAYRMVIRKAINKGILKDYLTRNSTEVINMLLAEYDYDTDISVKCEEARDEKAIEDALVMIKEYNLDPVTVAQKLGAPLKKVLDSLNQNY